MGPQLRVLTANLFHENSDPEAFADLLDIHQVDVGCFQELAPAQAEAISRILPHGKLSPRSDDKNGQGIALRNPGQVDPLPLRRRDANVVRLEPEAWPQLETAVEVVGVHFQAPHAKGPPWVTMPTRRAQCRAFVDYLLRHPPAAHRVVAGDFNATPIWPLYRRLAEHLEDAPLAFARSQGREPERTWGPTRLGGFRLLRIDHIFTEGLETLGVEVIEIPGSDHCAVIADLELA